MDFERIGIIGFGNFGQFLAKSFAPHASEVLVTDTDHYKLAAALDTVRAAPIQEIAKSDAVFIAVPFGALRLALETLKPNLRDETVVADVVSTKEAASAMLFTVLAEHPNLLATHPLFGPPSMEQISPGDRLVVTKKVGPNASLLLRHLVDHLSVKVIEVSASHHDQSMAFMQSLPFFIARALTRMGIQAYEPSDLSIPSFVKLADLASIELHHTREMFDTSQLSNPYARDMRRLLIDTLEELVEELDGPRDA